MSRIKPFKVYRNRRDYFFLKLFLAIPFIVLGVRAHFFMMEQDLPFLGNDLSDFLVMTCAIISFIVIFILLVRVMYRREKAARSRMSYQRQSLLKEIVLTCLMGLGALIIAALSALTLYSKYTSTLGYITTLAPLKQKTVLIQANIIKNPDLGKVIAVPAHKGKRDIVEPASYKIYVTLYVNDKQHMLPEHCYTGNEAPQLTVNHFQIIGNQSIFGLLCEENCALSRQFKTASGQPITPEQILDCEKLYRKQPNAKRDS